MAPWSASPGITYVCDASLFDSTFRWPERTTVEVWRPPQAAPRGSPDGVLLRADQGLPHTADRSLRTVRAIGGDLVTAAGQRSRTPRAKTAAGRASSATSRATVPTTSVPVMMVTPRVTAVASRCRMASANAGSCSWRRG